MAKSVPKRQPESVVERKEETLTKGGVKFSQWDEVYEIPSIDDLTPKEVEASWYDKHDYDNFFRQCAEAVARMESGLKLKDKKYSSLGLEGMTKEGFARSKQLKLAAIDAVLDEQYAQWDTHKEDEAAIAAVYKVHANSAAMLSLTRGLSVEQEVIMYLAATLDELRAALAGDVDISSRNDVSQRSERSVVSSKSCTSKKSTKSTSSSKTSKTSSSSKSSKSTSSGKSSSSSKSKKEKRERKEKKSKKDDGKKEKKVKKEKVKKESSKNSSDSTKASSVTSTDKKSKKTSSVKKDVTSTPATTKKVKRSSVSKRTLKIAHMTAAPLRTQ